MSSYSERPDTSWLEPSPVPQASNGASPHLSDELLAAWTANELAGDERSVIQRHLSACDYCQSALAEAQRIQSLVMAAANHTQPTMPPMLADRVLARLPDRSLEDNLPLSAVPNSAERRVERARRSHRRDLWRRFGALAAVLLLIASSALLFTRLSSHGNSTYKPGPPGVENLPGNWADVLPAGSRVLDVAVVSPTDIWAVGDVTMDAATTALLMHFDGKYWQRSPDQFPFIWLTSISMVSANEGWACGATSDLKPVMLHFFGGHWHDATASLDTSPLKTSKVNLTTVRMASATTGWALGTEFIEPLGAQPAQIFQYLRVGNIYRWEPIESLSDTTLMGMSVVSDQEVWLAGYTGQATWKTAIFRVSVTYTTGPSGPIANHWDTRSWDVGGGQLTSVSMLSSNDGWVVGADQDGAGILFQWDGQQWSPKQLAPDGQTAGVTGGIVLTTVLIGANTGWVYSSDTDKHLLYSTMNDHWFSYPVAEGRVIIAGAPVTATTFLAITVRVNSENNFDPIPVIYHMENGRVLPTPTATP